MAGLYKRGKSWCIKYYLNGKPVRKAVSKDKKTAQEYKAQLEIQIARGMLNMPVRKYSMDSFVQEYLQYSRTNKTPGAVKIDMQAIRSLNRILQPKTTNEISPATLERWKSVRANEVSPVAVNIELRQIKAMVHKGIQWSYMNSKQIEGVNQLKVPKKLPRFMSKDEITRLQTYTPNRWWDIFSFFILTGLRIGEFIHLKWDWVDFQKKTLTVMADSDWTPKDYESREIPLHSNLIEILVRLKKNRMGEYIFWSGINSATLAARIGQKFSKYCKKAGIDHYRIHDLRHTFASHMVLNGADLMVVRDILGHSSVKTTEIYAHLYPSRHHEAIARLNLLEPEKPKFGTQFGTHTPSISVDKSNLPSISGCSSMVEWKLPKLHTWVRFPSPAPVSRKLPLGYKRKRRLDGKKYFFVEYFTVRT